VLQLLQSQHSHALVSARCANSRVLVAPPRHQLSSLVLVEHRGGKVAPPTLNTLAAAGRLGCGDITALVGGKGVGAVAEQAAALPGVSKVRAECVCVAEWVWVQT
jgi:hypothetical protein